MWFRTVNKNTKMLFRVLAYIVAITCFVKGQDQKTCGYGAICIDMSYCPPLLNLFANMTQENIRILRRQHCGFEKSVPKVCCSQFAISRNVPDQVTTPPPSCFTPDAQEGRCVNRSSCQHLKTLMKQPNAENNAFLQNSKCGRGDDDVCCGNRAPNLGQHANSKCVLTAEPPKTESGCCGISSDPDRIYGGAETAIDEYPWVALIEYTKSDTKELKLLCGGSLISGRYVLTAGHCVVGDVLKYGTPRSVRLAEHNTTNLLSEPDCRYVSGGDKDCSTGAVSIPIEKIIPHEQYSATSALRRHDIALLRLARPALYSDFIRPICLPQTDATSSGLPDLKFVVAGWGAVNKTHRSSDVKQAVEVPYVNIEECQPSYSVGLRRVQLWSLHLCAGGEAGKDSCKGDSGGPLMYKNGGRYEVVGVVSFGPTPCGLENVPGVYSKVTEYLPWIIKNIQP